MATGSSTSDYEAVGLHNSIFILIFINSCFSQIIFKINYTCIFWCQPHVILRLIMFVGASLDHLIQVQQTPPENLTSITFPNFPQLFLLLPMTVALPVALHFLRHLE